MKIEVTEARVAEKAIVENLYPLYLHDLSEFSNEDVDNCGRFLGEGALDLWWEKDVLFPFLIRADAQIAGFALVCAAPHVSRGRDYRLNEFFVLRKYRRCGVGRAAATTVFDHFRGNWELSWIPSNQPAAMFWQRAVREYAPGCYQQALVMETPDHGLPGLFFSNP